MDNVARKDRFGNRMDSGVIGPGGAIVAEFLPGLPVAPLVIRPRHADGDVVEWLTGHRTQVDGWLHTHGALLLRGFNDGSIEYFKQVALAICPKLFQSYGDLPRTDESSLIYSSTPYPPNERILFHNEGSHLGCWPMRQFFSCIVAPTHGGETPIVDCRQVYAALPSELLKQFADRGLLYVRNFIEGLDVPWRQFFATNDRAHVERRLQADGSGFAWQRDGTLRTWRRSEAVLVHPRTKEMVFFNQLSLHHGSCLDPTVRAALRDWLGDKGMPRNVFWGDGEPIPDEIVSQVRAALDYRAMTFRWRSGDVLVLDNMLMAHSRMPFVGDRKVVVALGDMMLAADAGRY